MKMKRIGSIREFLAMALLGMIIIVVSANSGERGQILRTTLNVSNFSCGTCLSRISSVLLGLEGILGLDTDLAANLITVDHLETLSGEDIAAALTDAGFPAKVIGTGKVIYGNETAVKPPPDIEAKDLAPGGKAVTNLQVSGMTCGACLSKVIAEVRRLDASASVSGAPRKGTVTITHTNELAGKKIAAAITSLGYPAAVINSLPIDGNTITPPQPKPDSGMGCAGGRGCGAGCGASASSWQKLYEKYFSRKSGAKPSPGSLAASGGIE